MLKNNKLIWSRRALQSVIQISHQNSVIKTCLLTSLPVKKQVNILITMCQHYALTMEKAMLSAALERIKESATCSLWFNYCSELIEMTANAQVTLSVECSIGP